MGGSGDKKTLRDGWGGSGYALFGVVCVVVLAVGFGGWGLTATLAGAVVSQGQLRVEVRRQVVQHPEGGIVGEIKARDGDVVEAGSVMVMLDGTRLESELAALEGQLFEMIARRGRLEAEQADREEITFDPELMAVAAERPTVQALVDGQLSLFHARHSSVNRELRVYAERQAQVDQQIVGVESELTSLVRQKELAQEELGDMKSLAEKGLARMDRVMALEREAARLLGSEGRQIARRAELKGQIAELEEEVLRLEASRREEAITELRELGFRELELKERRIQLQDQLSRLAIRAPRSGVVYDMQVVALKSVIRPADPILYIIPTDSGLLVEARVEPQNVDEVYVG
ncbi:MAG: HlyD family type I secretion periplasmic adaptor subunit, partial [Pseudomonadota bacterium]